MLKGKTALIHGGGGAIGGAVARAFADAGARVHLAGRSRARLEAVAAGIGGAAEIAEVDALDERAVTEHAAAIGRIDVALNAAAFPYEAGARFPDATVDAVMRPIETFLRSNLITARAAARHMQSGAILTLSTAGARFARPGNLGFGTACAAIEQMSQRLAAELGPGGVRVVCLRPHAVPDAAARGSYTAEVFAPLAAASGVTVEEMLAGWGEDQALLGRLPTLTDVAGAAVFLASDHAAAITGAVVDLTCGNALRTRQFGEALVGVLD